MFPCSCFVQGNSCRSEPHRHLCCCHTVLEEVLFPSRLSWAGAPQRSLLLEEMSVKTPMAQPVDPSFQEEVAELWGTACACLLSVTEGCAQVLWVNAAESSSSCKEVRGAGREQSSVQAQLEVTRLCCSHARTASMHYPQQS